MSKSLGVSAKPEVLISFSYQLNNNPKVREAFLTDPLAVLHEFGIFVDPSSRKDIERIVEGLKEKYNGELRKIPKEGESYHWHLKNDGVVVLNTETSTGVW